MVRRSSYILSTDEGWATVWTTQDAVVSRGEEWIEWHWDTSTPSGEFAARGVARSRKEAQVLAERMLDELVAMEVQYDD